jgi:hypothetical protein
MALSILQHPAKLILSQQPAAFVVQGSAFGTPLRIAGGPVQMGGDSVQADSQKKALFEFSDYLQSLITERGKIENTPQIYTSVPLPVDFNFIEWVGEPPVNNFDVEEVGYYLLDGYIPKTRRKAFYTSHANLLAYLQISKSCLSWWPDNEAKKVLPDQKEFINFLQVHSQSVIPLKQNLSLSFTDGTSVDCGAISTINAAFMKLVYFPTGYTQ